MDRLDAVWENLPVLVPSERVLLISEIARRLGKEEWPFIDLTLRQFKVPYSDRWQGSSGAYVLAMIEDASDATLLELAKHVGYEYGANRPQIEPKFWRPGHLRLFISHLARHRDVAAEMQKALVGLGISSFVAHNDIEPTKEWQDEIQSALATCDAMLVLLHPGFHASQWTDQEIGYAMGRDVLIVAARYGEDPYGFLGRLQALQGDGKQPEKAAREVFAILRGHRQTSRRMAEALVTRLEQSDSFASAKANVALLEQVEYWDSALSHRARGAVKANSEVSDAWGVPDRVESLIVRMERTE